LIAAFAALGSAGVVDDDGGALAGGEPRDLTADAATGAGDDDDLFLQ